MNNDEVSSDRLFHSTEAAAQAFGELGDQAMDTAEREAALIEQREEAEEREATDQ